MDRSLAVEVSGLGRCFTSDRWLFRDLSFSLLSTEQVALLGESGVGKSTLLNILAGLEAPKEGTVSILGQSWQAISEADRLLFRRTQVGFVFQAFHLLPHLTAQQNVMVPCLLAGWSAQDASQAADQWLDRLGLRARASALPSLLSGGEQQRVAVARALAHRPKIVLADEPTGNLDPLTAQQVLDALVSACRDEGATLLMVTHSQSAADRLDRSIVLHAYGLREATARGSVAASPKA